MIDPTQANESLNNNCTPLFNATVKTILVILLSLTGFAFIRYSSYGSIVLNDRAATNKLTTLTPAAREFAAAHQFNTARCFMIDIGMHAGTNRFFVYNLAKDSIEFSGLVAHGRCGQRWLEGRKYGNAIGCGCTSLGRYKVGKSYYGRFGLAYKLYGLDTSNNQAFARYVVLHAHQCVPDQEVTPQEICQSDGCPTVSPAFMQKLATQINASPKPVLLWIYE